MNQSKIIVARVPRELWEVINQLAERENRTVSNYVRMVLADHTCKQPHTKS
jgi:predicted DNA-binding protein